MALSGESGERGDETNEEEEVEDADESEGEIEHDDDLLILFDLNDDNDADATPPLAGILPPLLPYPPLTFVAVVVVVGVLVAYPLIDEPFVVPPVSDDLRFMPIRRCCVGSPTPAAADEYE